jgi:hypothetical protein
MRLVEQAQQSKSKTQVLADKAASWLFYIALAAALVTAIAWTIAQSFNIEVLNRVVTVLVIACPMRLVWPFRLSWQLLQPWARATVFSSGIDWHWKPRARSTL